MSDQTAKLKCWKCKDIFHIRIKEEEGRSFSSVALIKPCPYCQTQCRVILRPDQVPVDSVYRGGSKGKPEESWFEKLAPGALTEHVFESEHQSQSRRDGI
jgi:hypothetical protein